MIETRYEHIILDESGVPMIVGTTMKVIELILDSKAYGWSPEELHFQHPYQYSGQFLSSERYDSSVVTQAFVSGAIFFETGPVS